MAKIREIFKKIKLDKKYILILTQETKLREEASNALQDFIKGDSVGNSNKQDDLSKALPFSWKNISIFDRFDF